MIDACFAELRPLVGTAGACRGSGKSRATHYRRCQPPKLGPARPRSTPSNALSEIETTELLALLRSPRFVDLAPAQVWAIVLDEGRYVASISTMYRVLRANDEVRERRAQAKHPTRARPELMADKPNMCWSWDITKLRGPDKGVWFDCYVAIDIFSRYVVGWMVAPTETAELAEGFITRAVNAQGVTKGMLNIHADRGTSMTSKASLSSWPTSVSAGPTAVRTYRMTTPTARRSTRPSSTARPFPHGSVPSKMPGSSAPSSSSTTTITTAIPASACTPPRRFTTARLKRSGPAGPRPSTRPTPPTRAGSGTASPARPSCRLQRGSTSPPSTTTHRRNPEHLSQRP